MLKNGLTLLEVLITISLILSVLMVAIPGMLSAWNSHQLNRHAQGIVHAFLIARSKAIHQQHNNIYVCSANLKSNLQIQGCQSTLRDPGLPWRQGILVYQDDVDLKNQQYDKSERLYLFIFQPSVLVQAADLQWAITSEGRIAQEQEIIFYLYSTNRRKCLKITIPAHGRPSQSDVFTCSAL